MYDGGVRSSIFLGNCKHCSAQNNSLEDTGSIGITVAGNGDKGNFAQDCLIWHNTTSGVAAANIAIINAENVLVVENTVLRPGHHTPKFGGGVSGVDLEPNTPADHARNIFVLNNLFDYEDAAFDGVGSAIVLQDAYFGENTAMSLKGTTTVLQRRRKSDPPVKYVPRDLGDSISLAIIGRLCFAQRAVPARR